MPTHAGSNACSACAKSKRKCGRQTPTCARCADKGMPCIYPPSKSWTAASPRPLRSHTLRSSVPIVEDGLLAEVGGNSSGGTANTILSDDLTLEQPFPLMYSEFATPSSLIQTPGAPPIGTDWFLAPESWKIFQTADSSTFVPARIATMKKYTTVLQAWFERWIINGSNPFIHSRLYSANFPACVQVAYATLASYIHRTPANADTVLQIVGDRSNNLLLENGAVMGSTAAEEWADGEQQDVDLFSQLSRLHALMVYQIIGLFDGDIRARHIAEGHMAIQDSWANKLFRLASKTLSNTHSVATHLVVGLPRPSTYSQQQWYLWILSESIRRTWLIAASVFAIYSALQQRWAVCPGSIMYTNRSGLWNATSSAEWEKLCLEKNVAFLQRFQCAATLPENTEPGDIDEFGHAMLDMAVDGELLEKWRDRSRGL